MPPGKDAADKVLITIVHDAIAAARGRGGGHPGHSAACPGHVVVLVSDDSGFRPLLAAARAAGWGVAVVAETPSKFTDLADALLPWGDVCAAAGDDEAEGGWAEEDEEGWLDDEGWELDEGWGGKKDLL